MPFTQQAFFMVFARYNEALWPLQIVAYLAGFAIVALLFRRSRRSAVAIPLVLAFMWGVNGIGYHGLFFAAINPLASVFAALFAAQAVLLAASPWLFPGLVFAVGRDARSLIGLGLIVFACALYPLWGALAGHAYPFTPVFGVAPCPTTLFTIGVLLVGTWRAARWLLVIPGVWSLIGGSAAVLLGVPQDAALIAALAAVLVLAFGHRQGRAFARHAGEAG